MKKSDILVATEPVAGAFERLGVPYYIGGSVASSAYGIPRATMDVDMISNLQPRHVRPLVELLEPFYYIDEKMIFDAIEQRSSFNLIHLETMVKIDIFIGKNSLYEREAFKRTKRDTLDEQAGTVTFYLVSPEDIVLNKLVWFRSGGEISEQQWKDIIGVLKVQGNRIDREYLQHWSCELEVTDLLEKAFQDAGDGPFSG
ncbi:hypothetical protein [Candidatus Electrothrix sp.]|uniref:hypothetical protein n=1 Tax=Candidatus Electrothrix sp. TaxID=2170559 RepID=UPI004056E44A